MRRLRHFIIEIFVHTSNERNNNNIEPFHSLRLDAHLSFTLSSHLTLHHFPASLHCLLNLLVFSCADIGYNILQFILYLCAAFVPSMNISFASMNKVKTFSFFLLLLLLLIVLFGRLCRIVDTRLRQTLPNVFFFFGF